MNLLILVVLCNLSFISTQVSALTLSPCVNEGNVRVAEVERGKTSNFTCWGFQAMDTVQWDFLFDDGDKVSAGVCRPLTNNDRNGCQDGNVSPTFTPSRKSATESVMTVDATQSGGQNKVKQGKLRCRTSTHTDSTCQMDLITPAVVSACSVKFERVGTVWRTTGRCDISSAYSSRGRYSCQWYRQKGSIPEEIKPVDFTPPHGLCNFTGLRTAVGVYKYEVKVKPGEVSKQASFDGEYPSAPNMTLCSADDYIAENTSVSCTCNTVNVGQPPGRLVWYRAGGPVTYGNYGDNTLTVSQILTRADHDVTQFRCVVDWAAYVQGESRTFKVGYKPERLSFKLGSGLQTEVTVKENNTVLFKCEADGRPVADMTVVRQARTAEGTVEETEVDSGHSPLTFPLTASCTDTGTYHCSASNVIGQADTSVSGKLYVECKPRIAQTEPALELNYRNQPDSLNFDVIAYPTLNASFSSFKYLGPNGTDLASNTSNIRLSTTCQQKPDIQHISICTLTVQSVTSPAAAGFYTVTLSNPEGSHDVRFQVLYNAPVPSSDNAATTGNGAVIGGSVAAVIVVVAIGVVIAVFVMKRRKGNPKERLKNSTNAADRTRNGQGRNTYREMEEPGFADGDQEAPSRPLSFAPMAVYAEVDKKKKKSQAAAAPEAEANGGKPADVYAEVNKPKKSNQGAAAQETEANGGQSADVYADVDKTKKKQSSGAGAKPKTGAKAAGKPKKDKKNKANKDESAHEYGNVGDIKQGKGAKAKKTTTPPKEETSSGKMVTPEGLIYTAVEFSQPPKSGKKPIKKPEEAVVYSAVDFQRSPPAP